ncbi:MAG: hypothetical protein IJ881_00775 [Neisseriaceae bacterium]|nr:hypothetical protein [Neisseriaceae bacterium]
MMSPQERSKLFTEVFNSPAGKAVLEELERMYDVGVHVGAMDTEYINVCKRSVIKQIKAIIKQNKE